MAKFLPLDTIALRYIAWEVLVEVRCLGDRLPKVHAVSLPSQSCLVCQQVYKLIVAAEVIQAWRDTGTVSVITVMPAHPPMYGCFPTTDLCVVE